MNGLRRAWEPVGLALVFAVVAAVTAMVVRREPTYSVAGTSVAMVVELVVATALIGSAVAVWRTDRAFAVLLAATAMAWLVTEWNSPVAGAGFTFGLVLYAAWAPLLAAAALRGVDGRRLDRPSALVVAVAFGSAVGVLGLVPALVYDPKAEGCAACPSNRLLVASAPGLGTTAAHVGLALAVVWTAAFVLLAPVRLAHASPARRRAVAPVLVPAAIAIALWGADAAHGSARGFVYSDPTDRVLRRAEAVALVLVATGVVVTRLRARRTRSALAQLVLDIGAAPKPGEVRAWLARSLGDPTVALLYPLDDGVWVDGDGRETSLPMAGSDRVTRVRAGGQDAFAVVHRPGLLDDPGLLKELMTTASLATEHDGLHAVRRARLDELRTSRARVVAVADAQRRELERDLHDGAQQRLIAVALAIRLARRSLSADDPELDRQLGAAEEGVREAAVELRAVAHGLFPAVLDEEGVAAALDELSEQTPRLVPGALPTGRFPSAVESAVYFAVVESLRLTTHDVTVDAVKEDGWLYLTIDSDDLTGAALLQIQDRAGAVGGEASLGDGRLRVEMPCE